VSWQVIGNRRYYYRHPKVDGRPRRVYVGTGPAAELAAAVDELRRLKRAIERRQLAGERTRLEGAGAALEAVCARTDVLARAALTAAGYHRHQRGAWRRRRGDDREG
jgi:hypothetical protein